MLLEPATTGLDVGRSLPLFVIATGRSGAARYRDTLDGLFNSDRDQIFVTLNDQTTGGVEVHRAFAYQSSNC